mmetsp:Transcript_81699/g.175068  ORF Transcript_81699/g.175068 Transcript_81699/m.175068 type:complete len:265 (-) Transcript_81699:156-950(-)
MAAHCRRHGLGKDGGSHEGMLILWILLPRASEGNWHAAVLLRWRRRTKREPRLDGKARGAATAVCLGPVAAANAQNSSSSKSKCLEAGFGVGDRDLAPLSSPPSTSRLLFVCSAASFSFAILVASAFLSASNLRSAIALRSSILLRASCLSLTLRSASALRVSSSLAFRSSGVSNACVRLRTLRGASDDSPAVPPSALFFCSDMSRARSATAFALRSACSFALRASSSSFAFFSASRSIILSYSNPSFAVLRSNSSNTFRSSSS